MIKKVHEYVYEVSKGMVGSRSGCWWNDRLSLKQSGELCSSTPLFKETLKRLADVRDLNFSAFPSGLQAVGIQMEAAQSAEEP